MKRAVLIALFGAAVAVAVSACGEKPQTTQNAAAGKRKGDTPAWQGTDNGYAASGWKPGDEATWQRQLNQRAQNQNEYVRIGSHKQ